MTRPRCTAWTPEEDALLKYLFEVGRRTKEQIAQFMPGRTFAAIGYRVKVLDLQWQGNLRALTPKQKEQLRHWWCAERLSAGQISKLMPDYSRNAIIGHVTRMGLIRTLTSAEMRERNPMVKPIAERRPSRPRNMLRFGNLPAVPAQDPIPVETPAPAGNPVTLLERRFDQCGWPVNDGGPFLFCGALRRGHRRYCEHHAAAEVQKGRVA